MPLPIGSRRRATTVIASPGSKLPRTVAMPTGEQARALLAQHPRRARVDDHLAGAGLPYLIQSLKLGARPPVAAKLVPTSLPGRRGGEHPGAGPVADRRRDPGLPGHLGGGDLGAHPARAEDRGAGADFDRPSTAKSSTRGISFASGFVPRIGGR